MNNPENIKNFSDCKALADLLYQQNLELNKKLIEVNDKLRQSEKLKSNFLSNVRNEVNNPLTSSLGLVANLRAVEDNSAHKNKFLDLVISDLKDLTFQLNNIFYTAEIEAGQITPQFRKADLKNLLESSINEYNVFIRKKELDIFLNVVTLDKREIQTDLELLRIIFINILNNAIQYSPIKGKININAITGNNTLTISIADQGQGIDSSLHLKIYEPFWQGDMGSTKLHKGHGIGLSIVKELVEILNGKITVCSSAGEGSEFIVEIPILNEKESDDTQGLFVDGNIELF